MSDNPIQLLQRPGRRRRRAPRRPPRSTGRPRLGGVRRRRDLPRRRLPRRLAPARGDRERRRPRRLRDRGPRPRSSSRSPSSVGSRILRGGDRLDPLARELDDYFAGRRHGFDVPLDLRLARGFRLAVLRHLSEIPYGSTESYAEVAVASGSPRAVRAVGSACATNPLPIVVPCHRVVRSDGSPRRLPRRLCPTKERLLALERAA